ncbi:glycosyl hydrolase [Paenibacillus doosanensis]|uniref:glycosyl hydrolase n=1 Tax=Paenibacillus doosanensis TaxID=1229154 RepID=UPI002180179B|nr:glycosyl hydrolase [Paenibacillus doosanensis]MCS7463843.1 glycosyl hydrolase [Paenibacillus doosanensis]
MIDASEFKTPSAEYRIYPFWFWNGDMEEAQIDEQIREMADKGLGGFFLCARQGVTIPYLSDAWFEKVAYAVERAKRHGLLVWLYDEYPYPSGIAGGEVILEHPDAKHRTLEHRCVTAENGEAVDFELPWGRTVSATAVPIDPRTGEKRWDLQIDVSSRIGNAQADPVFQKSGLTAYNTKRFFTYRTVKKLRWTAPAGRWEIHVFMEAEIQDYKYYGTFVDFGHEEAMRTFIKLTHERYKQTVGQYFGTTIKGMFTDETGYLGRLPWSSRMPQRFAAKAGYEVKDRLNALVDSAYEGAARFRYDLFQAANDVLRESYHKQCRDWCDENGLQYIAEVPAVRMTTQLYSHVVGSDSAHEKLGRSLDWVIDKYYANFRSNPKMASSLSRQLGHERVLCECFHSVGWSMTLQDAKWMIDRMAAMGINFFNFHSFFYTLDGLAKHDAPPSQFMQNPYWRHFGELSDYAGRISYMMSRGSAVRDIALLDPTTSLWTHLGNPIHATVKGFDYVGCEEQEKLRLERLKADWSQIGKELLMAQRDYDHLDTELLERAEVREDKLVIGSAVYSILVIPPISNLEAAAWSKINEFARAGGKVVFTGLLPYEKIEEGSPSEAEVAALLGLSETYQENYWNNAGDERPQAPWIKGGNSFYFIPPSQAEGGELSGRLLALLSELKEPAVRFGDDGRTYRNFLMQVRAIGDHRVVFVSNQEGETQRIKLQLGAELTGNMDRESFQIRRLNLETGEAEPVACEADDNGWTVALSFAPYESHLLELGRLSGGQEDSAASAERCDIELDASGVWEVKAEGHNAIRFDRFQLSLYNAENNKAGEGTVDVKTFIDQCDDLAASSAARLPLQFDQLFGTPKKLSIQYPVRCTYETEFIVQEMPSECELMMDRSAISGDYVIKMNGTPLLQSDFQSAFIYDHLNIVCPIRRHLKSGVNRLTVDMTVRHDWDGVIDALYVQGDFAVQFNGQTVPVIARPVGRVPLAAGPCPEYPYYAGTLIYKKSFELSKLPEKGTFHLTFSRWDPAFHDCAEVYVNGHRIGVRPWSPYRWSGDAAVWKQGSNIVEVKVSTSLAGLLEGKYFDYSAHVLRDVRSAE